MNERKTASLQKASTQTFAPVRARLLQRACACGGHAGVDGEYEKCRNKRLSLQRRAANQSTPPTVPPIVHEVLHSSGKPLDSATRAFIEPRFGHNLSSVHIRGASSDLGYTRVAGGGGERGDAAVADAGISTDVPAEKTTGVDTAASTASEQTPSKEGAAAPASVLSWTQVLRFQHDALWFFCGEHPRGFSTTSVLRASGFSDPTLLRWRIRTGSDKIAFLSPPAGEEVRIKSTEGSAHLNDIAVEVGEGTGATARSFTGRLTVRKPHHLLARGVPADHGICPPWATSCVAPVYWTELGYRIVDNVGGTIVGATVNENFPGAKTNDQANDWESPAAFSTTPFWRETNGTFVDNWFHFGGTPSPVAPAAPNAGQGVDRIPHEFYIGSETPGKGCRIQTHTAHRYLGFARHEGITTPAP